MNRINALLFEKYINEVIGEGRGRGLEVLFDPAPAPEFIKFGKYKIVNNKPVVKVKFQDALDKKYISSSLTNNLNQLMKVGFKFDNVYFVEEWKGRGSESISTLVLGKDPEGKPMVYVRKAGSMSGPKIYYETENNDVLVYYHKFSTNVSVTIEDILNSAVSGRKWIDRKDGSGIIDTKGNVNLQRLLRLNKLHNYELKDIPVKFGIAKGDFTAAFHLDSELTVSNLPRDVHGNVFISGKFESLVGGIEIVRGKTFALQAPKLSTLEGFPKVTNTELYVNLSRMDNLTSLEGLPEMVKRFEINRAGALPSLYGAPSRVSDNVNINGIPLIKNLAYFPEASPNSTIIISDCDRLTSLKGMTDVAHTVSLINLKSLVSITDLPAQIFGLNLQGLDKLTNLNELSSKNIDEISIRKVPLLSNLQGLPKDLKRLRLFCDSNIGIKNLIGCPENLKELEILELGDLQSLEGLPLNIETVDIRSSAFSYQHEHDEEDLNILKKLLRPVYKIGPHLQEIKYGKPYAYPRTIDRNFIVRHSQEVQDILNRDNPGIEMDI